MFLGKQKMNKNLVIGLLTGLLAIGGVQASTHNSDDINTLSTTYRHKARYDLSENDVKSFVYQWFAAFDHQREAGYYLNRIAEPVNLHYPDSIIKSKADFLRWYKGVTDNIIWNGHTIKGMSVSGDQQSGWDVSYDVNWKATAKDGNKYDVLVHQDLHIIRIGDALKIASLKASVLSSR